MLTLLRYAGLVLVVLVLAVVFATCGEGACGACVHACCVRSERLDRARRGIERLFEALAGRVACFGETPARTVLFAPRPSTALAVPLVGRGLPLRI